MTQDRELSQAEAQELITGLLGTGAEVKLYPFEFGWLAREITADQERSRRTVDGRPGPPRTVGQGSYIIDRTGVITVHSSLPIPLVMKQYAEARREGRIKGRQVWPPQEAPPPAR